jgi:hypothetical protein
MPFKLSLRNIERFIKRDIMGRDVPALDGVEVPQDLTDLLDAGKRLIIREALELVDEIKDEAWEDLEKYSKGMVPRESFDAVFKAFMGILCNKYNKGAKVVVTPD